jgi:hypothetical protein
MEKREQALPSLQIGIVLLRFPYQYSGQSGPKVPAIAFPRRHSLKAGFSKTST